MAIVQEAHAAAVMTQGLGWVGLASVKQSSWMHTAAVTPCQAVYLVCADDPWRSRYQRQSAALQLLGQAPRGLQHCNYPFGGLTRGQQRAYQQQQHLMMTLRGRGVLV